MRATVHVRNARVWTGTDTPRWRESISVVDGRVAEPRPPRDGERLIDAGGRVVLPGLVDAHAHVIEGGSTLTRVDLSGARSREDFERCIADAHAALPPGQWLLANGWSSENWPGRRLPDKGWLRAAGNRPAVCYRMDLHAALVNDAVLSRCDTSREPHDGRIVREPASGDPTGLMVEGAAWRLVNPLVPEASVVQRRDALQAAQTHLNRLGITAVGAMEYLRDVREVYEPFRESLTVRCRVTLLDRDWPLDPRAGVEFPSDDRLAVVGYKAFADGTLGSRSARLLRPYADEPGNRGMLVELAADGHLVEWADRIAGAGLSPAIHAIGDEAARLALDALTPLPPRCRPRLEHAQQLDASDLRRCGGIIASMQPRHKADDGRYAEARLGVERLSGTFAFRSLLEHGARLAFGSDWPVVTADPMEGIAAAVTGRTIDGVAFRTEQNLSVTQALSAYTSGAAYALGLDDGGTLRRDASGDFVILDRDPFEVDWVGEVPEVVMTVVGGEVVHEQKGLRDFGT